MSQFDRSGARAADALRPVRITRNYTVHAEGSVLIEFGATRVLCTASVEEKVPGHKKGSGEGWVTAEYGMLPRATHTRSDREAARGKQSGRTQEIQRLIGRSLRAVVRLDKLGERTLWLDCDVIEADGGTRTASINGAYALVSTGPPPTTGEASASLGGISADGSHVFFTTRETLSTRISTTCLRRKRRRSNRFQAPWRSPWPPWRTTMPS